MSSRYGDNPMWVGEFSPKWDEFMHYLYLPISFPGDPGWVAPKDLRFTDPFLLTVLEEEGETVWRDSYVYLTARRGYATPDNPLNRPGWHCDGFGTTDRNYTWSDRWPTRWFDAQVSPVPADHAASMEMFETAARYFPEDVREMHVGTVWKLSPFVVHTTPIVPAPGGMRSFLKVSVSEHQYNLKGNSHNYGLDYRWEMFDRADTRNDPTQAQRDFHEKPLDRSN